MYDFDTVPNRRDTDCTKWDGRGYDTELVTPMFVADMDFPSPPAVVEAVTARAAHGVYGYPRVSEEGWQAVLDWMLMRRGVVLEREWLLFSPGVIYSMRAAVDALTAPCEPVVIQTPVYPAFFSVPRGANRPIWDNPLLRDGDGTYRMDLPGLEKLFRKGARMLLFCSPQNPTGRVWTVKELGDLAALCVRYRVTVVSDEIHADILLPGHAHTPLICLPGMAERTVLLLSATKTFNMGGMQISTAVAADPDMRRRVAEVLHGHGSGVAAVLSSVAQTAAYRQGGPWLDELLPYLDGNCRFFVDALNRAGLPAPMPEGTYLVWADCSALRERGNDLVRLFIDKAGVEPGNGAHFGMDDHVRFTLATSRALVEKAARGIAAMMEGYC